MDSSQSAYTRRMRSVLHYLETHLDADLTLQKLSAVAHLSPYHFHRRFRAFTGTTAARLVRLRRLRRASFQLAFDPRLNVTEIAFQARYGSSEAFSRAFRAASGQSPAEFRSNPRWQRWQVQRLTTNQETVMNHHVELVDFPTTAVAAAEYRGPEPGSYSATMRLVAWRRENGIGPDQGKTFGIHYSDPTTSPEDFRIDVCVSYDDDVVCPNPQDVVPKVIPGGRCARIRHHGSWEHIAEADFLYREWLPASGETVRNDSLIFHYVNVGPDVREPDMITDVYLPLA